MIRLNKKYRSSGILLLALGSLSNIVGLFGETVLIIGGVIVTMMGAFMIIHYYHFAIIYSDEGFWVRTIGRNCMYYNYSDIRAQQLYRLTGGGVIIELHMKNGRAVSLQSSMQNVYLFLDHAFACWCRQCNIRSDNISFYNPEQSCWFPSDGTT